MSKTFQPKIDQEGLIHSDIKKNYIVCGDGEYVEVESFQRLISWITVSSALSIAAKIDVRGTYLREKLQFAGGVCNS